MTPSYGGMQLGSQHHHAWMGGVEIIVQCQPSPSSTFQSVSSARLLGSLVARKSVAKIMDGSNEAGTMENAP